MRLHFFRRRIANQNFLFNGQYIDPKGLFLSKFNEIPSLAYVTDIDVDKAYAMIRRVTQGQVDKTYQHSSYNHENGKVEFNVTYLLLYNNRLLEIGGNYVTVFYANDDYPWAEHLLRELANFYTAQAATPSKIGFATNAN